VHGTRIFGRLKKSWNDRRLISLYRCGIRFQAHIFRELVQVVRMPPCLILAFARKSHVPVAFGDVGDVVEVAEVADVSGGGGAVAGFHAAYLARGTQEALGYLFYREAFFVAEGAEQGA